MVQKLALIGLGLIGSSIAHAAKRGGLVKDIVGYDASDDVRTRARAIGFAHRIADDLASCVTDADLVILCTPVGAYKEVAQAIAPHLIAYNIVGTARDLEDVRQGEVIKYSASGFRDFTRIAASDPTMWRDIFLNNKDAVLEVLGRFNEDLAVLQRAVRNGDGQALFDFFTRTRAIRRAIIDQGQDTAAPNFGRNKS